MKHLMIAFAMLLVAAPAVAQEPAGDAQPPQTVQEKASYAIGRNIGQSLKSDGLKVSLIHLTQGIMDALQGKDAKLSDTEMQQSLQAFVGEARAAKEAALRETAAKNKAAGEKYLAENKTKEGVVTLPSGLQYKVLKSGAGATPKAANTVRTHYHGTLIDGTVFDSSVERGQPTEFRVDQVIAGWTEALQKMKVGDKWVLYVPSNLAYGPRERGPVIGPNSTLVFEIELLGIVE